MGLKVFSASGGGSDLSCALAIDYAVDHGAKVINASWGAPGTDPTIANAIQYANQHGVIVVAAAGNNGSNNDTNFFYPASYSAQYPNVISVAATDSTGALAGFSDYGVGTVQLAAPGVNILSTYDNSYGYMTGTSMAAPFVTGTVALVEAAHPSWSMSQVMDAVLDHTTLDPALAGKVTTGGIVNAGAAVANTDGAYVVSATPSGTFTSASGLRTIQLTFNEEINPATFTPAQVVLTGPGGTISGVTVSAVAGSNNHRFTITFPTQTAAGTYTLKESARRSGIGTATRWTRTATASTGRPPTSSST
jgi:subtilisin family serine protease